MQSQVIVKIHATPPHRQKFCHCLKDAQKIAVKETASMLVLAPSKRNQRHAGSCGEKGLHSAKSRVTYKSGVKFNFQKSLNVHVLSQKLLFVGK